MMEITPLSLTEYYQDTVHDPKEYETVPFEIPEKNLAHSNDCRNLLIEKKKTKESDARQMVIDTGILFFNGCEKNLSKTAAQFKEENFSILFRAHNEMIATKHVYHPEKYYAAVYIDMAQYRKDWEVYFRFASHENIFSLPL